MYKQSSFGHLGLVGANIFYEAEFGPSKASLRTSADFDDFCFKAVGRPAARRAGGRPATNFSHRLYINKGSCKKSAHLDLKWARNGFLKFLLVVGG